MYTLVGEFCDPPVDLDDRRRFGFAHEIEQAAAMPPPCASSATRSVA
jgi:hypothetical protein